MELKRDFIEKIENCNWLKKCGEKEVFTFDVIYLEKLSEVEKNISSIKWEKLCLNKSGDFTAYLNLNYKKEYNVLWNDTVKKIKSEYFPRFMQKIENATEEKEFSKDVINDIKFNLITLFMYNFYSECGYEDAFWEQMLNVYLSGHLPCGWRGTYPKGALLVY